MNNDRGLLSGSITILIGAVIAIMALVRGPWQVWLLLGVFTLWGLWVVLILLLPYMQQAKRHRQRQQRTRQLHAEGIQTRNFEIPDLGSTSSDDLLIRHTNHRILAYLRSAYPQATFEWCEKQPEQLIRNGGTGRIRVFGIDEFDHADVTLDQNANIKCDMVKIVPLSKVGGETNEDDATHTNAAGTAIADQLLRLLFTPLEGGLRISGAQICQNTMVGVANQQFIGAGAAQVRDLKTSCLDAFCMELSGALLTLAMPFSLLHIGEKQDQNYPQSPESENAQK